MTESAAVREHASRSSRALAAYTAHYQLLAYIIHRKFHLPEHEIGAVVHDVFVAFLRNAEKIEPSEESERAWLVGVTCNTCRYYWRKHREEPLPADLETRIDPAALVAEALTRLTVANVLRQLPARCRTVLHQRYAEGYTPEEIATSEAISRGSAKNLISRCLQAARAVVARIQQHL